jgi:hypothetical protein
MDKVEIEAFGFEASKGQQEAIDAGTLTLWQGEGGEGLFVTPTPGWPEREKSIVFKRVMVEAEQGSGGNVVMVPAVKGSYFDEAVGIKGREYAIAARVVDRLGAPVPEEQARAKVTMALRIDYAARIYGLAAPPPKQDLPGSVSSDGSPEGPER